MIRWRKEPPTPAEIRADTTSTELGAGTWHWWYRLPGGRSIVATLAIRMKPGCDDALIVDGELFEPSSWLNVEWAPCLPPDESIRQNGLVVVRFNAASPFGAMVETGVFDTRNLREIP